MSETPTYRRGDQVRVLVDEPYGTELRAGDIVAVVEQRTKLEPGDVETEIVVVNTAHGLRWLGVDVVELCAGTYRPALPDEGVDAQLRALLDTDPELAAWMRDADSALGAEGEQLSSQLADEDDESVPTLGLRVAGPGISVTDYAGDVMEITYGEREREGHGREGFLLFTINDSDPVVVPTDRADEIIQYMRDRIADSQRPE